MVKNSILSKLAFAASLLALAVIALGAFTRLIDAGLGCPDWPGCYGHLTAPLVYKAWAEMVHRYFVAGLSVFIIIISIMIFTQKKFRVPVNVILALSLLLLLVYQILLGQWTVTLKLLPIVVTQHLLGGFLVLSVLWLIYLNNNVVLKNKLIPVHSRFLLPILSLGLVILLLQIALGAWTSTNYASFSCPDFPFCSHVHAMVWRFHQAFHSFAPVGINYDGGKLPEFARQTIQMAHRFGALIFTVYIFIFTMLAMPRIKQSWPAMQTLFLILGLLCVQLCLGITNVIFKLPLVTAIGHTVVAALLLLMMITLIFELVVKAK